MSVTLKEISQKAGVSISTVSRVINDDTSKPASKETQEKVWKIVRELGYVPNKNARNLIKGQKNEEENKRTKAIGCIFTSTKDTFNDPFFSQISRGIQDEVSKKGYVLGYSFSSCDMSFSALYNNLNSNNVDGAVILGRFSEDVLVFLKKNIKNLVYAGVNYVNGGFDEVICDGYKGASVAVTHLIDLGHKEIGFVGAIPNQNGLKVINEHRFDGFKDTLEKNKIEIKQQYLVNVELNTTTAYIGMSKFLKKLTKEEIPTALFCANDVVAIGVMKAIHEKGLRIPDDISIIGLDDIEMAEYVTPPLTTIKIPKEQLGRFAVRRLVDNIENGNEMPVRVDLPFELIIRDSCKALK